MDYLFTFSKMSFETQMFLILKFSLFIFFCCLCIPELSPSTLPLSPYSSSSGFWLGPEAVVLWTGSSSLRVCSFFPWTLSYPCVPLTHLHCTLRLITASWQQPTRQPPLLQLLPLSVCSMCCCAPACSLTSHPSDPTPTCPGTVSSPGQDSKLIFLQLASRLGVPDLVKCTFQPAQASCCLFRQLAVCGMSWHLLLCYLHSVSPWAHSLLSWAHVPICKNGDNHHLMKVWCSMPAQCCLT